MQRAAQVLAALMPHCRRSGDGAVCVRFQETDRIRMRCCLCGKRGPPVGSGVAKSAFAEPCRRH